MCFFGVALGACVPYLMGFAASLDATGGISRMVGGAMPLATALGPVLGTRLSESFSYRTVGYLTAVGIVIVCVLLAIVNARNPQDAQNHS